jgi:4-amino-4-deoxy-L-arabinose transferase-like glycosyltransferase
MELFSLKQLPRNVVLVLVIGFALRALFVSFHQRPLISDERDYHQLSANILSTATYGYNGQPTAYRPVAYPLFVAGVYSIAGEHPMAVKALQIFIDLGIALLLFFLLRNESENSAVLAAALWCFFPPAILYSNFLLTETVFTFSLLFVYFFIVKTRLAKPQHAFIAGCLLGVLVLLKPAMLLFMTALAPLMYVARIEMQQYKFVVVGALVVLAPWIWRNDRALGKITLATNGGINLLIGNNPNATGAYTVSFPDEILQGAKSEVEADELAYRYGFAYIKEHPTKFVANGLKKLAHLFSSEGGLLVWSFHDAPENPSERYALKYASISLWLNAVVNIPYAFIMIVGMFGFVASERNFRWWIFFGLLSCWIVTHFLFFGGSRFHFPLLPFFALFAATVLPDFQKTLRTLSSVNKAVFSVFLLGLLAIWTAEALTITRALSNF